MSLPQFGHSSWPRSSSYHSLWHAWQKTTVRPVVASRWPSPPLGLEAIVLWAWLRAAWLRWLAAKAVRPRPATRPASRSALEASLEILTTSNPGAAGICKRCRGVVLGFRAVSGYLASAYSVAFRRRVLLRERSLGRVRDVGERPFGAPGFNLAGLAGWGALGERSVGFFVRFAGLGAGPFSVSGSGGRARSG